MFKLKFIVLYLLINNILGCVQKDSATNKQSSVQALENKKKSSDANLAVPKNIIAPRLNSHLNTDPASTNILNQTSQQPSTTPSIFDSSATKNKKEDLNNDIEKPGVSDLSDLTLNYDSKQDSSLALIQNPPTTVIFDLENLVYTNPKYLTLSCLAKDASIYYSINQSTFTKYEGPILLEGSFQGQVSYVVRAYAQKDSFQSDSIEKTYVIDYPKITPPTFKLMNGQILSEPVSEFNTDAKIELTHAEKDAELFYFIDAASAPILYDRSDSSQGIDLASDLSMITIKAFARKKDMQDSEFATQTFTVNYPIAAVPNFDQDDNGLYSTDITVNLTAPENATLYYRLNNGAFISSAQRPTSLLLTSTTTIDAYVERPGYKNSPIVTKKFYVKESIKMDESGFYSGTSNVFKILGEDSCSYHVSLYNHAGGAFTSISYTDLDNVTGLRELHVEKVGDSLLLKSNLDSTGLSLPQQDHLIIKVEATMKGQALASAVYAYHSQPTSNWYCKLLYNSPFADFSTSSTNAGNNIQDVQKFYEKKGFSSSNCPTAISTLSLGSADTDASLKELVSNSGVLAIPELTELNQIRLGGVNDVPKSIKGIKIGTGQINDLSSLKSLEWLDLSQHTMLGSNLILPSTSTLQTLILKRAGLRSLKVGPAGTSNDLSDLSGLKSLYMGNDSDNNDGYVGNALDHQPLILPSSLTELDLRQVNFSGDLKVGKNGENNNLSVLTDLSYLDLCLTYLQTYVLVLPATDKLQYLDLGETGLKEIYIGSLGSLSNDFSKMTSLVSLTLRDNPLTYKEIILPQSNTLFLLDLRNIGATKIKVGTQVDDLSSLQKLQILDLYDNPLESRSLILPISPDLSWVRLEKGNLTSLKPLDLSSTKLTPNNFYISNNNLSSIYPFRLKDTLFYPPAKTIVHPIITDAIAALEASDLSSLQNILNNNPDFIYSLLPRTGVFSNSPQFKTFDSHDQDYNGSGWTTFYLYASKAQAAYPAFGGSVNNSDVSDIQKTLDETLFQKLFPSLASSIPQLRTAGRFFKKEVVNTSQVVRLELENLGLNQVIPFEIGNIKQVTRLNLQSYSYDFVNTARQNSSLCNQISGGVPATIGNLTELVDLILNGTPPYKSYCPTDGSRNVLDNNISGALPDSIQYLSKLQLLWLNDNFITSLSPEVSKLTNLTRLYASANRLGKIPAILNLNKLLILHLAGSQIEDAMPSEIGNLSKLQRLQLHYNKIGGTIPASLGSLSSLKELYLSNTLLTGPIPEELASLNAITHLDLSQNYLSCYPAAFEDQFKLESYKKKNGIDLTDHLFFKTQKVASTSTTTQISQCL